MAEAASQIGDLQVRNRGTVGGNLAHADPASDLPAVAVALEAELEVQGPDGKETFGADGFFLGPLITALPEDGLLTSVSFAIPPKGVKSTYVKFPHPASGYAVVGVAAALGTGSGRDGELCPDRHHRRLRHGLPGGGGGAGASGEKADGGDDPGGGRPGGGWKGNERGSVRLERLPAPSGSGVYRAGAAKAAWLAVRF